MKAKVTDKCTRDIADTEEKKSQRLENDQDVAIDTTYTKSQIETQVSIQESNQHPQLQP